MGVARLCELLEMNFSLTSINLSGNMITDIGAASLANTLKINSTLTALDLYGNRIGFEGVERLSNALSWNQTLTYLNLESNRMLNLHHIDVVRARDKWIVRKNQSLFNFLLKFLN